MNDDKTKGIIMNPLKSSSSNQPQIVDTSGESSFKRKDEDRKEQAVPEEAGLIDPPLKKQCLEEKKLMKSQPKKKHTRKKHMDPKVLEIRRRIQMGCRDNDLASAIEAYEEAVSGNIRLEAQSFYNLLNLCDGLARSVHIGTPKATGTSASSDENQKAPRVVDSETRQKYIFQLRDHMNQLKYPLNETAYSAIVKLLSKTKEYDVAEKILEEAENVQQCKPKLRLYSSLLIAYCDDSRMLDALLIWEKLTKQKLHVTEKEYSALIKCASHTGDALVMQCVMTDLAENIPVPSKETVAAILEWFELVHSTHTEPLMKAHADDSRVEDLLHEIHKDEIEPSPDMGPVVNVLGWNISSACRVDTNTGVLQTGCLKDWKLNPVHISSRAWDEMRNMNNQIVINGEVEGSVSKFQGGRKGKKRMGFCPIKRKSQWDHFCDFLSQVGPLDVVIDGANVGHYEQNFSQAPKHIDYNQIDWIVRNLRKTGKKVLLVLHERHFSHDMMPDKYRPMEKYWESEKILYKTPRGMNDDWFWLHAAYAYRTLVVTNDEMRDHHFQMLAPKTFLRWKERYHIHFDFGGWEWSENEGGRRQRKVKLDYPKAYSRRIQRVGHGLAVPLAKRGDENRFMDGSHLASEDEPLEETYLCICPILG